MNNHTDGNTRYQGYSGILPNMCIKCKRTDVELTTFNFRKFIKKGSLWWSNYAKTTMKTYEVPVCTSCRPEIERHPRIIPKLMSELLSNEDYKQILRTKIEGEINNQINKQKITFFCPNCGAQRTALDDFCNSCGKDLRKIKRDMNYQK